MNNSAGNAGVVDQGVRRQGVVRLSGTAFRLTLLAVMALTAVATHLALARWDGAAGTDADLLRLLHGMVLIKAAIGAAVAGFVLWRLDDTIDHGPAIAYGAGVVAMTVSLVWLWALVLVPLASLLFYASIAALLVVAHRDRSLFGFLEARVRARR